jgi:hypothetical protein
MNSNMFHQRAGDCLRLAAECPDLYAREALMELADEFKQMARQLEADTRTRIRARPRRRAREDAATYRQPAVR